MVHLGQAKASTLLEGVDVYFNLHKRVWSCRCRKVGRVIAHSPVIVAPYGASLIVRKAGRAQVLREGKKNVHAFARLDHGARSEDVAGWTAFAESLSNTFEISYNPYRAGAFIRNDTGKELDSVASLIMLTRPETQPPLCLGLI